MKTEKPLTLGSLFDGSGGFPLGGLLAGITPVWASEIEPFPIRVTTKHLPFMKHYGNISAMDGGRIEPVDIITFGSPCQDMSVADRRDGLDGSRSSLFYEAVRIIKEMRCATGGRYPRFQTKGKSECAAKRIPEETLEVLTCKVLGAVSFDPDMVRSKITAIRAEKSNMVVFCMDDGSEIVKRWTDRSRAESWTPEMKEKARQRALQARRKKK